MLNWRSRTLIGSVLTATVSRPMMARCSSASPEVKPTDITLYSYQICPFCCRVKAYLDFMKIPYASIEVNPLTKSQLSFSKDYKKVPIAIVNGKTIQESGNIITELTSILQNDASREHSMQNFFPSDTTKWSDWSEKKLAVMLYPNITRSLSESWECFGYVDDVKEWGGPTKLATRAVGTIAMSFANGKIKSKYGIVDERKELQELLREWTSALTAEGAGPYLHGANITMPDLMVYGVLKAISGFQTFRDIMGDNDVLRSWYANVDSVVSTEK